jgi:hypothetical protein
MVVVFALAITRAIDVMRRRERFGRTDVAWIIPTLAYGAWELIVRVAGGRFPLLSNHKNLALPFVGTYDGVRGWLAHPLPDQYLQFVQLAALVLISALAFWNLRRSTSSGFEKLSFVLAAVLTVMLSKTVWANDPHIFRTMVEMFVLGSGILLGAPKFRLILLTCVMWGVWLLVAQYNLYHP